jgi:4-amino-4-deoxy-L-arabinose transferase-like glycosyltransferase
MQRTSVLLLLAALSFLPVLGFYMVGEEGIYTISSMEMWARDNWLIQTLYGQDLHRPPLMNWLVMPLAELIGWSHVLMATRLVSILATLGMTAWLYWLCYRLFADKSFALFAALACLSLADLLLYRGWLAYTDPTFAFFTFGAMATLWIGAVEKHKGWLLASVMLVSCALLAKAFTAYVFYGTVALVLLSQRPARAFLLAPSSLAILALILITPAIWFTSIPQTGGHSSSMLHEIAQKLSAQDLGGYLGHLVTYPLEIALRLSPAVLLAAYLLLRRRVSEPEAAPDHFRAALLIAGLSFLPYWLSPQSGVRYLLPVYPLIALVCARIVWRSGRSARTLAMRWFGVIIAVKFLFVLLVPYYQGHFRGENYVLAAREIMQRTEGFPLYAADGRSIGLNIIGQIDIERWPLPPLEHPPRQWNDGFVLSIAPNEKLGSIAETYTVAGDQTYLLCRGAACAGLKAD